MGKTRLKQWSIIAAVAFCIGVGSTVPASVRTSAGAPMGPIVVQNYYYALPGKANDVYEWRLHASEVRAKLGLPRGRVLRRISSANDSDSLALADVIWECEYPSQLSREQDVERLGKSAEFKEVERHMDTLLRKFERAIFEPADVARAVGR